MLRLLPILMLAMLLAGCNRAPAYVVPANSVPLAGCPIAGVSLPPGSVVNAGSSKLGWNVKVQASCDLPTLERHLDAILLPQGYKHSSRVFKGKTLLRYDGAGTGKWLSVIGGPEGSGVSCMITVMDE